MKRFASYSVLVLLAALLAAPSGFDVAPTADARKGKGNGKSKIVTRTSFDEVTVSIPTQGQAAPYPSPIRIGGPGSIEANDLRKGKIRDVDVKLRGFGHAIPDEVDVLLAAPSGRTAVLLSDAGGGSAVDGLSLTLDDEAAVALPDSAPLTSGAFRPTNVDDGVADAFPVAPPVDAAVPTSFDGTNPTGAWRLSVVSDAAVPQASGSIAQGWEHSIEAEVKKRKNGAGKGGGNGGEGKQR